MRNDQWRMRATLSFIAQPPSIHHSSFRIHHFSSCPSLLIILPHIGQLPSRRACDVVEGHSRRDEKKIVDGEDVAVLCVERRLRAEVVERDGDEEGERARLSSSGEYEEADEDERHDERRDEEFLRGAHGEAWRAGPAFPNFQSRGERGSLK